MFEHSGELTEDEGKCCLLLASAECAAGSCVQCPLALAECAAGLCTLERQGAAFLERQGAACGRHIGVRDLAAPPREVRSCYQPLTRQTCKHSDRLLARAYTACACQALRTYRLRSPAAQ